LAEEPDIEAAEEDEELDFVPSTQGKKIKVLQIPRFQEVRWNSMFYCLARIWLLKGPLLQYAIKDGSDLPGDLTANKFEIIADLVDCLGPICAFSTAIQSNT
jgi:hypothetical protein